ncbi:MAG: AAA family ATPase [Armatimonadetes bacterium]|nr:AAA family ATPase [Armatimonadota bacterium]
MITMVNPETYWGLQEKAFSEGVQPRFAYLGRSHEDALMMIHFALTRNKGAALLVGENGTGKTTLAWKLVEILDQAKFKCVFIRGSAMSPIEFLAALLHNLGANMSSSDIKVLRQELHIDLLERYDHGQKVVVVIDNAQEIKSQQTLKEIQNLLDSRIDNQFLVSPLIIGDLALQLQVTNLPSLYQRLAFQTILHPLQLHETQALIQHRLVVAGFLGYEYPFTPEAIGMIHRTAGGKPAEICRIADLAMTLAQTERKKKIDAFMITDVITQYQGELVA